jgi:hypothetical protein
MAFLHGQNLSYAGGNARKLDPYLQIANSQSPHTRYLDPYLQMADWRLPHDLRYLYPYQQMVD